MRSWDKESFDENYNIVQLSKRMFPIEDLPTELQLIIWKMAWKSKYNRPEDKGMADYGCPVRTLIPSQPSPKIEYYRLQYYPETWERMDPLKKRFYQLQMRHKRIRMANAFYIRYNLKKLEGTKCDRFK